MRLENCATAAGAFTLAIAIFCNCFIGSQSKPYDGTYLHVTPQNDRLALYDATQHSIRPQRSIYGGGGGWAGGGGAAVETVGLSHITKEELIALLEAWKEVEAGAGRPEPEPEIEPEPPAPAPIPVRKPEPEALKLPPPGVPLTVSLPAFVPIQLQAMYTAPAPALAPAAAAGGAAAGGIGHGIEEAAGPVEELLPEAAIEPAPAKDLHQTLLKIWSAPVARQAAPVILSGGPPKKVPIRGKGPSLIKLSKSRSLGASLHHAGSAPRIYTAPPPPYLSHAPGPLKLIPSSQLLSNWH